MADKRRRLRYGMVGGGSQGSVGVIHREELLGRAWVRIWPLSDFGVIKHE